MMLLTIIASFLLSYSLVVFNPLFIYFGEPERLGTLPFSYLVTIFLIASAVAVLLIIPLRKFGRSYSLGICFLCSTVFLYSYVVQIDFGLFRGNKFGNEELIYRAATFAYFVEPIALGILFFLVRSVFNLKKIILSSVFGYLLLSLSFNLMMMARENSLIPQETDRSNPLELDEAFRFSGSQKNILLIIPDAGSGFILPELMEEGRRGHQFDGFVNFRNTVSVGSYTMSSTAALMAGDRYFPDVINARNDLTILEHINEAYNWLADTLKKNGYESRFIGPKFAGCSRIRAATLCTQPERYKSLLEERFGFDAVAVFSEKIVRYFSIFKAMPFSLKPLVYRSAAWNNALEGSEQLATAINKRYFEYLMLRALPEMSAIDEVGSSQFNLLWNSELIAPMNLAKDCQVLSTGRAAMYSHGTRINATRCVLDAFSDWFQWMKDNGVYDNTKIIIASDHGAGRYNKEWVKRAVSTMLLVKDFNSSGSLQTSDTLMQNSDVAALICSAFGGCEGIKDDPSKSPMLNRVAKYFHTTHGNFSFAKESRLFEIKEVFEIRGDLHEHSAFK